MKEQNTTTWTIDPGHSSVQFKVKHLGIASVVGTFTQLEGKAICRSIDFDGAEIDLKLAAESITTNNKQRDEHLRGEMLFDAEHFPDITFTGRLEKVQDSYELTGDLTVRGIARNIRLSAAFNGTGMGRWDDTRAGFELSGKINRKDFGMNLEVLTGTGSLVVGEDVNLLIDVELIKQ